MVILNVCPMFFFQILGYSQPVTSPEAFPTLIAWGLPGVPLLGLGRWCWGGAGGLGHRRWGEFVGEKPMGKRQLLWFRDVSNEVWTGFFLPETCQVCTKLGLDPGSVILSRRTLQFWGRVVHCPRSPKAVSSAGLFGR